MATNEEGPQLEAGNALPGQFEHPLDYKKRNRKGARSDSIEGALNINSLMDIMTILLVFLLINITSDPLSITQDDYLTLAKSTADYNPEDSVPITITKRNIIVDHKQIVKVDCASGGQVCQEGDYTKEGNFYSVDKSFKEDGSESSFLIEPLEKKLSALVKQQKEEAKELNREFKAVATIISDRDIPFRLIAEVVHTAGMAGLSDLRFAVVKTGGR
ncbi:MAG: biopolymer transporter ExbD [Deltaproteobacteria bacterium]|nr:biopolymer transporter ExbD [Deltaproteobacteria bacterium]MCB9785554.1 biopolymer transporter ExbD [Deltaproteobacteria bacterium]